MCAPPARITISSTTPARPHPIIPVPEKFDLAALPNKTVTVFVSTTGPKQFAAERLASFLLTQIRQATPRLGWSGDLGFARHFRGPLRDGTRGQYSQRRSGVRRRGSPGIAGVHESPCRPSDMVTRADGSFFPITQSIIHLNSDLTKQPRSQLHRLLST